jgi:hypothetical protein
MQPAEQVAAVHLGSMIPGELVAQDEDLQVLGGVAAGEQGEQLDGAAQGQAGESRQHPGWPPPPQRR